MKAAPRLSCPARIFTLLAVLVFAAVARAQAGNYQPGDKIEYLDYGVWEQGVFVASTPDGKQPIIRKKPSEFYPEGSQTAYDWERIRPLGAAPAVTTAPAKTAPKIVTAFPTPPQHQPAAEPVRAATFPATGNGLMTQADVLDFLKARLGAEPFSHPQFAQIKQELAELIKRRGVNFRYETLSDFSNALGKYGASSEIIFPLQANFGPPTNQPWLMGRWSLSKIGATVDRKGNDGYIYRQTEIGVKDVGGVTVNSDGTYVWQIDVPRGVARGTWRQARPEEMPYQGGDAIVLLKAKGGVDWIVHQDRVTELKGDWVNIAQLDSRQIREGGFRTGQAMK